MSDSATNLDTISTSQASKEVTANALFDALSPPAIFGRRASTTSALTWGYYGGEVSLSGVPTSVANATVQLVASRTQNVEAGPVSTTTAAITAVTLANPCVITSTAHPFFIGDVLWISGIVGTIQLNASFARVTATAANTVTLALDSTGFTAWSSAGTLSRMTDAGAWAVQIGKGIGTAIVAPVPLYNIVAGASTVTSYTDLRIGGVPAPGFLSLSVAGGVDVVATAAHARNRIIELTGLLTVNIAFILPRLSGDYAIVNSTTGAFSLTARTPGGTGIVIAAAARRHLMCDGIDIFGTT